MEGKLHQAQEALTKKMNEEEVLHSSFSLVSSLERRVGSFKKNMRGIGSKLMIKMGYEGKGLDKHAQGMVEHVSVEERPKNLGLGYVQFKGEDSKYLEACDANLKRTFIPSSKMQIFQICFKYDFHCFKPLLQQEDGRHAAYGEHASSNSFQDKKGDVSLQMKVVASTSSSSHEDKKDEHSKQHKRYKSFHCQFDCVFAKHDNFACLNGRNICCTYCGRFNHDVSRCWMRKKAYKN